MNAPMRFAVETWSPDYGTSIEPDLELTSQQIDPEIELPSVAWEPITPQCAVDHRARLLFVDGVRRVDARIWIDAAGTSVPALCATIGAGVVEVEGTRAQLVDARVVRGVFGHGVALSPIVTSCGTYEAHEVAGDTPEALVIALQDRMGALEHEAALAIAGSGHADALIMDGPLRGRGHLPGSVGYVKTQHTQYLAAPLDQVVGRLVAGQRTPLFAIAGMLNRISWYARLPGPRTHALAGIVRCEIDGESPIDDARALADQVTARLPRFASVPHKDSRAPQNLYPIAGLERELRRRLGDPWLLERALRVAARHGAPAVGGPPPEGRTPH